MALKSIDPRINRLSLRERQRNAFDSPPLDQLPTYEVFVQLKEGKVFEHAGIVHAATSDMAFLFAKEQYSRRYTCSGMWLVPSDQVWTTDFTDLNENIYDLIVETPNQVGAIENYEVFHLTKRGKQHQHVGRVRSKGYLQALQKAKAQFDIGKPVINIWLILSDCLQATKVEDQIIWSTLNEKTHRNVISYRIGDRLKLFKEKQKSNG